MSMLFKTNKYGKIKKMKFKIGDKVKTGKNGLELYGVTNEFAEMKVIDIRELKGSDIKVEILNHSKDKIEIGNSYWVDSKYFELVNQTIEKVIGNFELMINGEEITIIDKDLDAITLTKKELKEIYNKIK